MASNLKSDPSEWVVGESNPKEFTASAVVEVVNASDSKEEVERIGNAERYGDGDERSSVTDAVTARYTALNEQQDGNGSEDGDAGSNPQKDKEEPTVSDSGQTPSDETAGAQAAQQHAEENKDETSKGYDPYKDPDVPSSFVAEQIRMELENGESPTLQAVKDGVKK